MLISMDHPLFTTSGTSGRAFCLQVANFCQRELWTLPILIKGWEKLLQWISQGIDDVKLATFVDGLDEFAGPDRDMARLFSKAAQLPRDENVRFKQTPRRFRKGVCYLPIFEASRPYIPGYQDLCTGQACHDEGVQERFAREPVETPKLVEEIIEAANGVFLWFYFAVGSLLRGLDNYDRVKDLQRKLRVLPRELKQLYIHIMSKVDEDYQDEALTFLQLVSAAIPRQGESILRPVTLLGLYLATQEEKELQKIVSSFHGYPYDSTLSICIETNRRLKSRTGGLLKAQIHGHAAKEVSYRTKVNFLHRSVREFHETKEMRSMVANAVDVDHDYAMLKSTVYEAQVENLFTILTKEGEE